MTVGLHREFTFENLIDDVYSLYFSHENQTSLIWKPKHVYVTVMLLRSLSSFLYLEKFSTCVLIIFIVRVYAQKFDKDMYVHLAIIFIVLTDGHQSDCLYVCL